MQLTYLEAIRQGIWEEMEHDPTVFCLGEDIGIYGGAFKVTDGFIDRFGPERVIDTPIAESAIVGAAFGASLTGMRPVAEFQFMDFIGCAFNQITNMVAKTHYRLGRARSARPARAQRRIRPRRPLPFAESRDVVRPQSRPEGHLSRHALRRQRPDQSRPSATTIPCIFFEHKYLYRRIKEEVPQDDYVVPIGKARVAREGSDISVITYAAMVHTALEAADILAKEGIEIEILDLRTLVPA